MSCATEDEKWRKGVEIWREVVSRRVPQPHDGANSNPEDDPTILETRMLSIAPDVPSVSATVGGSSMRDADEISDCRTVIQRHKQPAPDPPIAYVPIDDPLGQHSFQLSSRSKLPPKWMSLLPANRVVIETPPFKVRLPSKTIKFFAETPKHAPGSIASTEEDSETTLTQDFASSRANTLRKEQTQEKVIDDKGIQSLESKDELTDLPPFPFFQNARAPIVPSVDSSWGRKSIEWQPKRRNLLSPGPVADTASYDAARFSKEFIQRYATPSIEKQSPLTCEICKAKISSNSDMVAQVDEKFYHLNCLQCKTCRQRPTNVTGAKSFVTFRGSTFHKECLLHKTSSILSKMETRNEPEIGMRSLQRRTSGLLRQEQRKATNKQLSSLFATAQAPDSSVMTCDKCEGCSSKMDRVHCKSGPRETQWHRACLVCKKCETHLKMPLWYEWDRNGKMELFCRACWWAVRALRGMPEEEIQEQEDSLLE